MRWAYLPNITAVGARRALVGPLLKAKERNEWGPPELMLRDPAVGLRLSDFCRDHLGRSLKEVEDLVAPRPLCKKHELQRAAFRPASGLSAGGRAARPWVMWPHEH